MLFKKTSTAIITLTFSDTPTNCNLARTRTPDEICLRLKYRKSDVWQILDGDQWVAAPQDVHDRLKEHISYAYIPLRRDHEVANWGEGSLLKMAVEAWLTNHTSQRDRISPQVVSLSKIIQGRALDGLSKHLRRVTPVAGSFSFDVGYKNPPDYSILLKDISMRVTEGSTTVDLEDCGSGTQSMAAFALYSYLAELQKTTYILGIEEPEMYLHPQAQRELLKGLKSLPLQVLFTTHSTIMIDQLDHEEVVLCKREKSVTRGFEVTTKQLHHNFWITNGINREQYYQFHRRRNSEFFFSNFIVITESPIDGEVVKYLLEPGGADPTSHSVSIVSLDGVTSLPHVYHLLKALQLPFASVLDKDYFLPYLNDELSISRDTRGFPKYKSTYDNSCLINIMIPDIAKRVQLIGFLNSNHSKAMNILEDDNIFCFRWSFEIDLVATPSAANKLYQIYQTPIAKQNTNELLVSNRKSLKRLDKVLTTTKSLPPRNLPSSYKRIKNNLSKLIRETTIN